MKPDKIKTFLKLVGASQIEVGAKWVKSSCPLARWKHKSGTDSHPSFGVLYEGKTHWNCFTCNQSGSLAELLDELVFYTQKDTSLKLELAEAYKLLDEESSGYIKQPDWTMYPKIEKPKVAQPWPESWLHDFMPASQAPIAVKYLASRRVDLKLIKEFDIRFDPGIMRVCFPVRNREGRLVGMRGRLIEGEGLRYYDYSCDGVNNTSFMWFNEHRAVDTKPVVVTEGALDAIAVYQCYPNVVSPLWASAGKEKLKMLRRFPVVHCFFDNDEAGQHAFEKVMFTVGKDVVVKQVKYPNNVQAKDPSDLPTSVLADVLLKHGILQTP